MDTRSSTLVGLAVLAFVVGCDSTHLISTTSDVSEAKSDVFKDDVLIKDVISGWDAKLCEDTGGQWDEGACGHYVCGEPNACRAEIPGCNCGPELNYIEGIGCALDAKCGDSGDRDAALCKETGGRWDTSACGHYQCGVPNACEALIPGCDCGPEMIFIQEFGCLTVDECRGDNREAMCERSGGKWDPAECGQYWCGLPIDCDEDVPSPGCNCGPGRNFLEDSGGCFIDFGCDGANDEAVLCQTSGGEWDPAACGHYICGNPNDCDGLFPGCNCGDGANFIPGLGCARDASCSSGLDDPQLCSNTGGTWDEASCSHYRCGLYPSCTEIKPGCDCGSDANFVSGQGCLSDPSCAAINSQLCSSTGGTWDTGACGHYACGLPNPCGALIPGCDCGKDANFVGGLGCATDPVCSPGGLQQLCETSGGAWDAGSCGDYVCDMRPTCKALIPGCDCGTGQSFSQSTGCFKDTQCTDGQFMCELTLGTWDLGTCGHYMCGQPNACAAIIPGCDCGSLSLFLDIVGCVTHQDCNACPDLRDPAVEYISQNPADCAAILFQCDADETPFSDSCGCGCVNN